MNEGRRMYLTDLMSDLERQMRLVAVEMMESGHDELMQHGDELLNAAAIVGTWICGLRKEIEI